MERASKHQEWISITRVKRAPALHIRLAHIRKRLSSARKTPVQGLAIIPRVTNALTGVPRGEEPMQLRVENGMKALRHQVHGKRSGGELVGLVLNVGGELDASVTRNLFRLSKTGGKSEQEGGNTVEVPRVAYFAGAKRTQLAVLMQAGVTADLREALTGVTCLASVRPQSPRLASASLVLAGGRGFSPGRRPRNQPMESAHSHDLDEVVDEGGIYSW
jgi:hypothetical protein